jgi:hypothetical protein
MNENRRKTQVPTWTHMLEAALGLGRLHIEWVEI